MNLVIPERGGTTGAPAVVVPGTVVACVPCVPGVVVESGGVAVVAAGAVVVIEEAKREARISSFSILKNSKSL